MKKFVGSMIIVSFFVSLESFRLTSIEAKVSIEVFFVEINTIYSFNFC